MQIEPNAQETAEAVGTPGRRAAEPLTRCKSGGRCGRRALEGERFCAVHLEELRRIRAEFEAESKLRGRRALKPTCQTPGCANPRVPCANPRVPPNPLCSECAEGAVDELAA
jgi:hypothetical protein